MNERDVNVISLPHEGIAPKVTHVSILAIDAGTTGVTALLVEVDGTVSATGYAEFAQHFPADGHVEHDLGEIWSATLSATRSAIADRESDVRAIGITNQRETVAFWDRETLGAARRAIVWQDRRTASICDEMREHEARITELTGLRLDPYFSATKLAWVRQHDPRTWANVVAGRVAIGTIDSYLIARMTRGLAHITDVTNASRTLLVDLATGTWNDELLRLFDVPADALPEITSSYGELARSDPAAFLGLDVPIAGIAGDQQAALVGQTGFDPGDTKCTYGTGSFLLANTGAQIARSTGGLLTTIALGHPGGRLDYALEGSVFVTGSAVQWLRDGLGIIEHAGDTAELAAQVPDAGGVVFVPALTGLGAPDWDPTARGLIIGITRGTTRAHIARATLDAITYSVRDVVDLMRVDGGLELSRLAVDGGAAANDVLCQLQADQLDAVVDRSAQLQTTGLGAAFLAGLGAGVWTSFDELRDTRASSGTFAPRGASPSAHAAWRDAVERAKAWAVPR